MVLHTQTVVFISLKLAYMYELQEHFRDFFCDA